MGIDALDDIAEDDDPDAGHMGEAPRRRWLRVLLVVLVAVLVAVFAVAALSTISHDREQREQEETELVSRDVMSRLARAQDAALRLLASTSADRLDDPGLYARLAEQGETNSRLLNAKDTDVEELAEAADSTQELCAQVRTSIDAKEYGGARNAVDVALGRARELLATTTSNPTTQPSLEELDALVKQSQALLDGKEPVGASELGEQAKLVNAAIDKAQAALDQWNKEEEARIAREQSELEAQRRASTATPTVKPRSTRTPKPTTAPKASTPATPKSTTPPTKVPAPTSTPAPGINLG